MGPRATPVTKPRLVSLNVKLTRVHRSSPSSLTRLPGVVEVIPVFPDEKDAELRKLYVLQVETDGVNAVLRALRSDPAVAYAEESAPRKVLG
ncbi:MAG TPA: hypothetical protein VFM88_01075 [Vicinamibacteria bacterium]|nr:hypothetical protein [Vicinamibacteria bacterium]